MPDDSSTVTPAPANIPHGLERIGAYRLIRLLGSGGMGVVYLAEQDQPRRTVAIKLVRSGLSQPELLRRLEHEAQVLGRLRHPGIAAVYEAGTADSGSGPQPFFAMEYVPGRSLLDSTAGLPLTECVELLIRICDAVQHAHQRGVIHRDLKPSNILVDESGQPKVLDFGVSRAVDSDLYSATVVTSAGQVMGTVQYMSPEQVAGDPADVDTRSDVYALGAILFEIIARRPAVNTAGRSLGEVLRCIQHDDAPRLRAVLRDDPSLPPPDLDTITAKALSRDRARRYQTAADLAADLGRFLADQPILARPPSAAYQVRMFARRNRPAVLVGMIAAAAVLLAVTGVAVQAVRATRAEARERAAREASDAAASEATAARSAADAEARKLTVIKEFLENLLSSPEPRKNGAEVKVADVLRQADEDSFRAFREAPEVEVELRSTIGRAFWSLSLFDDANHHLAIALSVARTRLPPESVQTVRVLNDLATVLRSQSRLPEANAYLDEALLLQRRRSPADTELTAKLLNNSAVVLRRMGRMDDATDAARRSADIRARVLSPTHPDTLSSLASLASILQERGRLSDAATEQRRILDLRTQIAGPDDPETLSAANNLGVTLFLSGRLDEARDILAKTLETRTRLRGEDNSTTLATMSNLGAVLKQKGDLDAAHALLARCAELHTRVMGERNQSTLTARAILADLRRLRGDPDGAASDQRIILDLRRSTLGEEHQDVLVSMQYLALALLDQRKPDEAHALLSRARTIASETLAPDHWRTFDLAVDLAACIRALGRTEEAEAMLAEAASGLSRTLGDEHFRTARARALLASTPPTPPAPAPPPSPIR